ncbi:MAG: RnfABCDGE type electron transport complex subunit A [Clostridia bacterium]|jgi:electron transport complex protein RnfA|nr:RnfABCDGE type electron transport complex subunit A [Eubacteriales bacterium]MDD3866509.1 RnfABCDGE type electron transport complex subunit A [Eubacteriales bacterium]MDD4460712.1 RnfABCDGE type electron transport complex subunit A [Eubacteriales bacterium]NCC47570.1 RnfABCDGE type electron transport complex subunit A [Clostridia bacterium]
MKELLIILFSAILVDNFVLSKFLGVCPFLGVSKNIKTAMGMSFAVLFVMVLATAITWPIFNLILFPLDLNYLQTVIFILVIASLVQIIEVFLKKVIPPLYSALGIFLPLITTNCAILGLTILNIDEGYTFVQSMFSAVGAGLGFMLALFLFSGIRVKVDHADVPKFMKGLPIALVSAALVSISFFGFKGLIEQLFS